MGCGQHGFLDRESWPGRELTEHKHSQIWEPSSMVSSPSSCLSSCSDIPHCDLEVEDKEALYFSKLFLMVIFVTREENWNSS